MEYPEYSIGINNKLQSWQWMAKVKWSILLLFYYFSSCRQLSVNWSLCIWLENIVFYLETIDDSLWRYLFLLYEMKIPPREVTFLVSWIFERGHFLQTWLHYIVCTCLWNVERCKIHLAKAQKQVRPIIMRYGCKKLTTVRWEWQSVSFFLNRVPKEFYLVTATPAKIISLLFHIGV